MTCCDLFSGKFVYLLFFNVFATKAVSNEGTQRNRHLRLRDLLIAQIVLFRVISKSGNSEVLTFTAPSLFAVPCPIFIIYFLTSSLSSSLCVFVARLFRHKGAKKERNTKKSAPQIKGINRLP